MFGLPWVFGQNLTRREHRLSAAIENSVHVIPVVAHYIQVVYDKDAGEIGYSTQTMALLRSYSIYSGTPCVSPASRHALELALDFPSKLALALAPEGELADARDPLWHPEERGAPGVRVARRLVLEEPHASVEVLHVGDDAHPRLPVPAALGGTDHEGLHPALKCGFLEPKAVPRPRQPVRQNGV